MSTRPCPEATLGVLGFPEPTRIPCGLASSHTGQHRYVIEWGQAEAGTTHCCEEEHDCGCLCHAFTEADLVAVGWLPPDEAERLKADLDEAKRVIRNAHQAIRTETLAASVALAMFTTTDRGGPSLLDELTEARAELERLRTELDKRAPISLERYRELNEWAKWQANARDGWDARARKAERELAAVRPVIEAARTVDREAVMNCVVGAANDQREPEDYRTWYGAAAAQLTAFWAAVDAIDDADSPPEGPTQ